MITTRSSEALRRALVHVGSMNPAPDVLLLTGDLTENGAEADYLTLRALLDETLTPHHAGGPRVWATLGNHDDHAAARAVLGDMLGPEDEAPTGLTCVHGQHGALHVIGLDTVVPDRPHGELGEAQLAWLRDRLERCAGAPVVLFMHHPPLISGMSAMDACSLMRGRDELARLVREHGGVQLIAAGHLHRPLMGALGGAPLVVAPSCSHQLALDLRPRGDLAVRLEPPQIGIYRWTAADGLAAHFSQVHAYPGPFAI